LRYNLKSSPSLGQKNNNDRQVCACIAEGLETTIQSLTRYYWLL